MDKFNEMLVKVGADKRLSDDEDQFQENYLLYVARKNGLPKDDLPGKTIFDNLIACRVFTKLWYQIVEVSEVRTVHLCDGACASLVQTSS